MQSSYSTAACLCTGKCKVWPYTCNGAVSSPYTYTPMPQNHELYTASGHIELIKLQNQINAIEYSINLQNECNEQFREKLEKIDPPNRTITGSIPNIFEFIAVDPKRRDDIRHVKNALYDLYCWILENIEDNKYRSNGIDLLETAAMQLNKAISRRKGNGTQNERRHD